MERKSYAFLVFLFLFIFVSGCVIRNINNKYSRSDALKEYGIEEEKQTIEDSDISSYIRALDDNNPYVFVFSAKRLALSGKGASDALPVLIEKIGHKDKTIKRNAALYSAKLCDPSSVCGPVVAQSLIDFLYDPDHDIRITAVRALEELNYPSEEVILALQNIAAYDSVKSIRVLASNGLGKLRAERNKAQLLRSGGGDLSEEATAKERSVPTLVDVDQEIPQGREANPQAVAVVIGNQNYRQTSPVSFAANDAAVIKRYLVETLGYAEANILYVEDADLAQFNTLFGTAANPRGKLHQWVRPGESDVFVYYSGHGVPSQEEGGSTYFVPVNADPNYILAGGYSVALFRQNLEALPARSLTVVVDACFSGVTAAGEMLLSAVSPAALKVKKELPAPVGALFMASAAADQVSTWYRSKNHSTFTYWWLKGLGGAADVDGNRDITVAELKTYLDREVSYTARRETGQDQTPVILGEPQQVVVRLR